MSALPLSALSRPGLEVCLPPYPRNQLGGPQRSGRQETPYSPAAGPALLPVWARSNSKIA
jgi:hypothetical protein